MRSGDREAAAVAAEARALSVPVIEVPDGVATALSDTATPQGVVAVVRWSATDVAGLPPEADLVVVLADVRDPGNAGTLLRSAAAARADAVVFASGAADPFGAKTVRAAAGAHFHVPLVRGVALEDALAGLRARGFRIVAADAGGTDAPEEVDFVSPVALVLGNEGWGIREEVRPLADVTVGIPMPGDAESLNVGIAGSILIFEALRQRRSARGARLSSSSDE